MRKRYQLIFSVLFGIMIPGGVSAADWAEVGGIVCMEAEKGTGSWTKKSSDATSGGEYIVDPGSGSMSYTFTTTSSGNWFVYLRAMQDPSCASDQCNDVFVTIDGQKLYGTKASGGTYVPTSDRPDGMRHYGGWGWTFLPKGPGSHTPGEIRDNPVIAKINAGKHTFVLTHRSAKFSVDKILLKYNVHEKPTGIDQPETFEGGEPVEPPPQGGAITLRGQNDFDYTVDGYSPFYTETRDAVACLAINPGLYQTNPAAAVATFSGESGTYDVEISFYKEVDGESKYELWIDGQKKAEYSYPRLTSKSQEAWGTHTWESIAINNGSEVKVVATANSNKTIPESGSPGGYAWSRGRWSQLKLTAVEGSVANVHSANQGRYVIKGKSIGVVTRSVYANGRRVVSTKRGAAWTPRIEAEGTISIP